MEALKIKASLNTLEVSLDPEEGQFVFSGRSYSENSADFFKPISEWIERYSQNPAPKTVCSFTIEYFNSASRKSSIEIFRALESIHKINSGVTVIWNHEEDDEGMREMGEEYKNLFKLDFQFKII